MSRPDPGDAGDARAAIGSAGGRSRPPRPSRGPPFALSHGPSLLGATLAVTRKELVTSFRDRQTTLYTLVLPIVLYPFLFWCMIQASVFLEGRREHTEVRVGLAAGLADDVPPGLAQGLERDPRARRSSEAKLVEGGNGDAGAPSQRRVLNRLVTEPLRVGIDAQEARAWLARGPRDEVTGEVTAEVTEGAPHEEGDAASPEEASKPLDAVLYLAPGKDGGVGRAEILYDSSRSRSQVALARIQSRMPAFVRDLRARAAAEADAQRGGDGSRGSTQGGSLEPFRREPPRNVATQPAVGAYLLSYILPFLFVIMAVMGAFFPAVDLTCGERERKTAETTLLLPVPRNAVHLGKILAVCAAALIATALNVSALALSAEHLLGMLPAGAAVEVDLPVAALIRSGPLLLLFAFFVSSVLTGIAALARTFKEGQALLGPVQILFVVPALVGALPGVQPTPFLASVPVVNLVLCFRAMLQGESYPLEYGITALSLLGLSIAAIGCSLWLLSREALFASEQGTWALLRGLARSQAGPQ